MRNFIKEFFDANGNVIRKTFCIGLPALFLAMLVTDRTYSRYEDLFRKGCSEIGKEFSSIKYRKRYDFQIKELDDKKQQENIYNDRSDAEYACTAAFSEFYLEDFNSDFIYILLSFSAIIWISYEAGRYSKSK